MTLGMNWGIFSRRPIPYILHAGAALNSSYVETHPLGASGASLLPRPNWNRNPNNFFLSFPLYVNAMKSSTNSATAMPAANRNHLCLTNQLMIARVEGTVDGLVIAS